MLADGGLVKGKRIGIDATSLEANAAMRSIARGRTFFAALGDDLRAYELRKGTAVSHSPNRFR